MPALCDVEICSALRRGVLIREVSPERASQALEQYLGLPLTKYGHMLLVRRMFELRENFTASDATYVALSERLGATLVTCDARMTRAIQGLLPLNVIGVAE